MITETDKLETEIIVAIQDSFCLAPEDFEFSQKVILDYLTKCFAAQKRVNSLLEVEDENSKLRQIIEKTHSLFSELNEEIEPLLK